MKGVSAFFRREPVLVISAVAALLSMLAVPPGPEYMDYIDLRVLCLLFCLMAVVDGLKDQTRRVIQPLFRGEMAAVCAPSYGPHGPVTVKELAGYRLLLREKGSGNRVCIDAMFESHGCSARPVVDSISDLSLLKLAEEGFGITILPRELAAEQLAAGRLKEVKLTDDTLERQYFIAYNEKKYLTGRMKEVLQVLKL